MDSRVKRGLLMAAASVGAGIAARTFMKTFRHMDFRDRTVMITGGSRGLGLVLARRLVDQGAKVAICARDADELQRASDELEARGGRVYAACCDVTEEDEVNEFVQDSVRALGEIDVLINNAGIITVGPLESMTLPDFEDAVDIYFWAPLRFIFAVLPSMVERGEGRIVNISSIGGLVGIPHLVPYCCGKFALTGLSEGLRAELVKDGVYVTTVCPGLMRTGSHVNAEFKGGDPNEHAWFTFFNGLPVTSVSCERAAAKILRACSHGDAYVELSIPSRMLHLSNVLFPRMTSEAIGLAARMLPRSAKDSPMTAKGRDIESPMSHSIWTRLADEASRRNNELGEEGIEDDDHLH
jgi:NAD(P)-dependent dehydrogenase (short-subunit alcohol dehydrogenase family)